MTTTAAQQVALDNALIPLEKRMFQRFLCISFGLPSTRKTLLLNGSRLIRKDFTFRIENRDYKKQEKMYYPIFTKAIIHHFITKDKSISMRNRMFMHTARDESILGPMRIVSKSDDFQVYGALLPNKMTNQQMRDSDAYKTYLAYATSATSPKMKRKFKKPTSPSKKRTLVTSAGVQIRDTPGVSVSKKKAPAKAKRSKGIELLSDAALFEEAQFKRALKRRKLETNIHQAGDLSEGANFESEVSDEHESKGKSVDTYEGTGSKPGVPDVSTTDSSERENESWGDSGDETNEQGNDDHEQADDELTESDNPRKSDKEEMKEYDMIDKELYGDVNVRLIDPEKDDEEMTNAGHEHVEVENVNQEGAVPESETLSALYQRIIDLQKDVKELKTVDHSSALFSTIKSEV
ncbi:hypothetical protein Tco_1421140 [Tanacetum coccineum]